MRRTPPLIIFILFVSFCQTPPERVDKKQINNPTLHAELKPLEREIVETNYRIKKQAEREKEFIQVMDEAAGKFKDASKEEKEKYKSIYDRAKLKSRIETARRESLQLKLKERIARYELKKAAMISSESETPLELQPYEKFHKAAEAKLKSKTEGIMKMEEELNELEKADEANDTKEQ